MEIYFMFLLFYPKWILTPKGHFMLHDLYVFPPLPVSGCFHYTQTCLLGNPDHSGGMTCFLPTTPSSLVCGLRDGLALTERMSRPMVVDTQAKETIPQMRILFLLTQLSFVHLDSNGIMTHMLNNTSSVRHRVTEIPFLNNSIINTAFFFLILFLVVYNHTVIS